MASEPGSGWREPRVRLLRTLAVAIVLVLLAWIVIVEEGHDAATVGTLAGVLLVMLGHEVSLRLPGGKP